MATALLGAQLVAGLGGSALVRAPCVSAIARGLGCNRRAPCPVLSLDDGSDAVAEGGDEPAASEAPARTRSGSRSSGTRGLVLPEDSRVERSGEGVDESLSGTPCYWAEETRHKQPSNAWQTGLGEQCRIHSGFYK